MKHSSTICVLFINSMIYVFNIFLQIDLEQALRHFLNAIDFAL